MNGPKIVKPVKKPVKKTGSVPRAMNNLKVVEEPSMPEDRYVLPETLNAVSFAAAKRLLCMEVPMVAVPSFGVDSTTVPGKGYPLSIEGSALSYYAEDSEYEEFFERDTVPNTHRLFYLVRQMDWLKHADPEVAEVHTSLDAMSTDDLIKEVKRAKLVLELARPKIKARVEGCT